MIKKELLAMRPLKATAKMMETEKNDIPQVIPGRYGHPWRKYSRFARCRVESGILKVALFFPDHLRAVGCLPSYEVFIDRTAKKSITYDRMKDKWRTAKVDNLDWPYHVCATDGTWMSTGDKKVIKEYLGVEKDGYDGVLEYQEKICEEMLVRRHKRETDPWDMDLSPMRSVPKDWNRWVDKVGMRQNYIFYRYEKRGAKQGYCTYCGKEVPIDKPRYNKVSRCPCCHHEVTFKSIGRLNWLSTDWNCVYLLQPRLDGFIVREFWAARIYTKVAWKMPEVKCIERMRTIYDQQLNPRTYFWGDYKHCDFRWIKGLPNPSWYSPQSSYYYHGNKPGRVYGKGLSQLLQTKLEGTGLTKFLNRDYFFVSPDEYLFALKEKSYKEQLSKANLPKLTSECLSSSQTLNEVFKGCVGGGLTKALRLDTQRLGRLRRNDGGTRFLTWLQWEKEQNTMLDDKVIHNFCEWGINPSNLDFIRDRMSPLQVHNYLCRQAKESGEQVCQVLTTWKDYLSMAQRLKMDTNDAIIYRARLLRKRHDELVERIHRESSKDIAAAALEKFPAVDDICHSIKGKYEYTDGKYTIVVPNGVLDIIVEGRLLSHCVGTNDRYWDRIQRHETYILFLRKASDVDIAYYTLEAEPNGTVRQVRTRFNRQEQDIDDVRDFLSKWQKAVSVRLTNKDRTEAAASRDLREQEFEQMRRDNVTILAGHLAGRKLVDVLTADLMESAA